MTENGCAYREKFDRILVNQKIRPGQITEFSSTEAIKQCVATGMGIALLPAVVVAREIRHGECAALRWAGPSLAVVAHLAWDRSKWISPSIKAFQEMVTKSVGETKVKA